MQSFSLDKLSDKCKENCKLFNVMFVLLSACNQDCAHCYIPEHNETGLPKERIYELIDESRKIGALNVTFTGGEVFVRKDFLEIVEYARKKHLRVFIMSNASLVDKKIAKKLINLNISGFSTTIFSLKSKIHDKITRRKGSLKLTLKAINYLKQGGIDITIKTPLMEYNKFEYKKIEQYAKKNNFVFKTTATIFGKVDGDDSPRELSIKSNMKEIVKDVDRINNEFYLNECKTNSQIPCSAGFSNICINYDGAVWPCNTLTLEVGNVNNNSLSYIWNKSKLLQEWRKKAIEKISACEKCNLKPKCTRCPGLAFMEDGNLYGCSTSAKNIAENR